VQVSNPLQMNDWGIKKLVAAVLGVQAALAVLIGLNNTGIQILFFQQFVGLAYLLIIPGVLVLRVLKIHNLEAAETVLYTVGLSILSILSTGVLINAVYPSLGIAQPLSTNVFAITMCLEVLALCVLAYLLDKDFANPKYIDVGSVLSPMALFCFLMPLVSIFGAYLMNLNGNNSIALSSILIISIAILLVGFGRFANEKLFPMAIFAAALSLLFSTALISKNLWGWDIQGEYFVANLVVKNSIWNWTLPFDYNSSPAVTILAPVLSKILDIDLVWVFKIVYSLLFALLPVGVYAIVKKQTDSKIAFYSAVFLIINFTFFLEMPGLLRQEVGEVFLVLMLLSLFGDLNRGRKTQLLLLFALGLSISHYSLAYLYVFILPLVWIAITVVNTDKSRFRLSHFHKTAKAERLTGDPRSNSRDTTLSIAFVFLFIVLTLTWYSYTSSSSALTSFALTGQTIVHRFSSEFLVPQYSQGATAITQQTLGPLHNVAQYLRLFSEFLVTVGLGAALLKRSRFKIANPYIALAAASYAILVACIVIPNFASALNVTRLYHISLIVLAPFFVLGALTVFRFLHSTTTLKKERKDIPLKAISVFLIIFLLFDSNFLYATISHDADSIALSKNTHVPVFSDACFAGASWWYNVRDNRSYIYTGGTMWLLLGSFDWVSFSYGRLEGGHIRLLNVGTNAKPDSSQQVDVSQVAHNSYVYLGATNTKNGNITVNFAGNVVDVTRNVTAGRDKVYDSGDAQLYYG
jgi:uncharacterized membrane protein